MLVHELKGDDDDDDDQRSINIIKVKWCVNKVIKYVELNYTDNNFDSIVEILMVT